MGRSETIPRDQFAEIPYFDLESISPNRCVLCLEFFLKGEWNCWIHTGEKFQKMLMTPVRAQYFGDKPERWTDQYFVLLHLMAQRASFPDMYKRARAIWEDFHNLATSLAKLRVFFEIHKHGREVGDFARTEVEYILIVCRSIYDLLQEMIAAQWERTELFDKSKKKKDLPGSFAGVLMHSGKRRTVEEISDAYGMPEIMAKWYDAQAGAFLALRELRDNIAHRGQSGADVIFDTERGFAIRRDEKPWSSLHDWPKECELANRLVPLRPVLCSIIRTAIAACDSFALLLNKTIQLPRDLCPGLTYYSRGYHDIEFARLNPVIEHSLWCDTDSTEDQIAAENGPRDAQ